MTVRIFLRYPVSSRMIGYPASVRMFYQKVRIRSDICFISGIWSNIWKDTQYPVILLAGYPESGRMFYQKIGIRSDICFTISSTWSNIWIDNQYPVKQLAGYPIFGIRSNICQDIRHPFGFWLDVLWTVGYFVPLSSPSSIFKGEWLWTWDKKNKINVENVLYV